VVIVTHTCLCGTDNECSRDNRDRRGCTQNSGWKNWAPVDGERIVSLPSKAGRRIARIERSLTDDVVGQEETVR
jgi:hypothetical protein